MADSGRKKWRTIVGWSLVGLFFVIISSLAVGWANGLVYDPTTNSLQPTVIVSIEANLEEVEIYLNDQLVADRAPVTFRSLKAGQHQIRIEKVGYQTWRQIWQLDYGQVGQVGENVRLIANAPKVESTLGQLAAASLFDLGLLGSETGELLDAGRLVTSFAAPLLQAHRFYDGYIYQMGAEIRLAWPEAALDYPVFDLGSANPTPLIVDQSAWQVRFQANDRIVTIYLLVPNELPVRTPD